MQSHVYMTIETTFWPIFSEAVGHLGKGFMTSSFSRELGYKLTGVFHFNINLQLTSLQKGKHKSNKNVTCFHTAVQYIKHSPTRKGVGYLRTVFPS